MGELHVAVLAGDVGARDALERRHRTFDLARQPDALDRFALAREQPRVFEDFRLAQDNRLQASRSIVFTVMRDALLRGVCFYIRPEMGGAHVIDTWRPHTSQATP
jgi:hypothetical protein